MIINDNNNNNYKQAVKFAIKKAEGSLKNEEIISVLFSGVGGQGIILATTILANAAINAGYDVKVSEVHGMAQRGGSVEGSVRFGKKVYSPTINKADFIIALEKLEALRYMPRLTPDGFLIINDYEIYPSTVFSKEVTYPQDIESRISSVANHFLIVDAVRIAGRLNEIRASNVVLLGVFSNFLPIDNECWLASVKQSVPAKALNLNLEAFNMGKNLF